MRLGLACRCFFLPRENGFMTIKGVLLAGAAICALSLGSAFAEAPPHVHVTALRPGHATVKTAMHVSPDATKTSTYAVYTEVFTPDAFKTKTNLLGTFYTLNDNSTVCSPAAAQKVILSTKKTLYAKLSTGSVTYSIGCPSPTIFRGTVYDLITRGANGKTDTFVDTLTGKVKNSGEPRYTFNLNLDVNVEITK